MTDPTARVFISGSTVVSTRASLRKASGKAKDGGLTAPRVPMCARLGIGRPRAAKTRNPSQGMIELEVSSSVEAPPPRAPAAPPAPVVVEWFYMDLDNMQQGPTNADGLRRLYMLREPHAPHDQFFPGSLHATPASPSQRAARLL